MNNRHLKVFILCASVMLIIFAVTFAVGRASEPAPISLDGEITSFSSSPDGSQVALVVMKKKGDIYASSLVLYNAGTGRITCTVSGVFYQPGVWSPDSRWLALTEEQNVIVCVDRKGTVKRLRPRIECGRLMWDPESRNSILYCGPWNSKVINSISVADGKETTVRKGREISGLYTLKGKAYYAEVVEMPGTSFRKGMQCRELRSGKKSILLPLYGRGFDFCSLTISPDGVYYFFSGTLSSGTVNVLARVEDAALICRKPYLSILYQRAFEDDYSIIWPRNRNPAGYEEEAVIQPHSEPGYFLDLQSGSRRKITEESYSLSDGLFFISPGGLKKIRESGETVLLIGHRPWRT
ncbi:MAG: hypothetical protein AB2L14_36510 [Candidatus Xenobiia bacterium LiM19]